MKLARLWCVTALGIFLTGGQLSQAFGESFVDHDDSYVYALPYAASASFPVIQSYGSRLSHRGSEFYTVDFRMPVGTPVHAARDGIVVSVEYIQERSCWSTGCGRYANHVAIQHSDSTIGQYFHLQTNGVLVKLGDQVIRGQQIAVSGNTGYTTTPHLHFGVYAVMPDRSRQSIDVRFETSRGVLSKLRPGNLYRHPDSQRAAAL